MDSNFKITLYDVFGAIMDVALMCVRPTICVLVWNFGVAIKDNIPQINFLQAVAIIVIYHVLLSYIPFTVKNNK